MGMAAPRGGGCSTQTPLPQQCPTAQCEGKERSAHGLLPWPGSAPWHRGFLHHPVAAQPGWQGARSPGTQQHWLLDPKGHLWPGAPGTAGAGPRGAALAPDTARIHGSRRPGQRGAESSPSPANKTGIQSGERGLPRADLSRPRGCWDAAFPRWAGRSQRAACCQPDAPDTLLARSHAGPLCPGPWGQQVAQCGGGHSKLPACPAMSHSLCKRGSALSVGAQGSY